MRNMQYKPGLRVTKIDGPVSRIRREGVTVSERHYMKHNSSVPYCRVHWDGHRLTEEVCIHTLVIIEEESIA